MIDLNNPEVQFALEATRQAALTVRHVQKNLVSPALTKGDRSPVTVADYTSQALVGRLLADAFPGEVLVAEEDSAALRQPHAAQTLEQVTRFVSLSMPEATPDQVCDWIDLGQGAPARRFWALDPIDGTKGFLRGEQYVVALALLVNNQVQIGVLGCPNLVDASRQEMGGPGSLVVAVRSQGTWVQPLEGGGKLSQLRVSTLADPSQARLLRSVESGHTNIGQIDLFAQSLGIQAAPVSLDSQAKYAMLAAGAGDLILRLLSPDKPDYREKIWDQAAGSLVLEEAGGFITDLHGALLDFSTGRALLNNRGILASNQRLHPAALRALRDIGA
jgi:3'(2'), 5'-bisphosphate nucleotidase